MSDDAFLPDPLTTKAAIEWREARDRADGSSKRRLRRSVSPPPTSADDYGIQSWRDAHDNRGEAGRDALPSLEVLDVGDDDEPISPRQWLLGTAFCREFVSGLIAPGAGAKTSLRLAQALALTSGRPLTGEYVFVRSNVLFVCLEDGMKEARRRVRAGMIHHKVKREEVRSRLFLTTPMRMKMAQYGDKNTVVPGDLDRAIRAFVEEKKIDLVMIDPVKKAHAVEENNNDDMDAVVTIFAALAIEKNIAVDVASHERKSGTPAAGDVNRARGAGAMKDGGRLMYTNTWMTEDEAKAFGVSEAERRILFRVDSAKVNLAPLSAAAQWFRLVSINLDNGDEVYLNGDEVQTVERWTPPGQFEGFSTPISTRRWRGCARKSKGLSPNMGPTIRRSFVRLLL